MFDSVLAHFVRQLGSARFSLDRSTLVVRFAGRPAVRVSLSSEEATSLVKAARDLANTVEATFPPEKPSPPVLATAAQTPEALPSTTPASESKPVVLRRNSSSKK
jgi:hypothetical protein